MQSQKLVIVVALLLALLAMTACGGDTPAAPAAEAAPTEAESLRGVAGTNRGGRPEEALAEALRWLRRS